MTEECNCSQVKLLWVPQREGVKGLEIQRRGRRNRVQSNWTGQWEPEGTVRGKAQAATLLGDF